MVKVGWLLFALAIAAALLTLGGAAGDEGPGPQVGLAGGCDTSGDAWGVAVSGGYAYVANGSGELVVVNDNDPSPPESSRQAATPSGTGGQG